MMDPSMEPKLTRESKKTLVMKVPINDVEQARKAIKDHKRFLQFLRRYNTPTGHLTDSAPDGQVNAKYRSVLNHIYYNHTVPYFSVIAETSDYKTVYNVTGSPGLTTAGKYQISVEVGQEKNEMGKDVLVIRTNENVQFLGDNTNFYLCCYLSAICMCCFTSCVASYFETEKMKRFITAMPKIQRYVNSYAVKNNNPVQVQLQQPEVPVIETELPSDIDTTGLVKRF